MALPRLSRVRRLFSSKPKSTQAAGLPYPTVDLWFWNPAGHGVNFGDFLSKVIVSLVLAQRGRTLDDEAVAARQLLAIGSVLHFARDGACVWGSGVNGKIPVERHGFAALDVRAVRGPLTRRFLSERGIDAPEIYGDPALLLPSLANGRFSRTSEREIGFVPNLNDIGILSQFDLRGLPVISPKRSWDRCVADILGCDLVLASSLHGIIVAEAYGIPARYVRLTENEDLFKYADYYSGTGRPDYRYATSVAEALAMGGEPPAIFDASQLLNAFPFDLWDR